MVSRSALINGSAAAAASALRTMSKSSQVTGTKSRKAGQPSRGTRTGRQNADSVVSDSGS